MMLAGLAGAVPVILAAPLLLHVFGSAYADQGADTLRVLSLGVLGLGFNYWVAMRLRIAHRPFAMVGAQLACAALVLTLCVLAAPHGTVWVAAAWGIGQLLGGSVGYVISRTVAPLRDLPPVGATTEETDVVGPVTAL
jgi:branched-subunit amino acid ABC-type transport system permease component